MSKKPTRAPAPPPRTPRQTGASVSPDRVRVELEFEKAYLMAALLGQFDAHVHALERELGVYISARGNRITIEGEADLVARGRDVLRYLYVRLEDGGAIDVGDVVAAVALIGDASIEGIASADNGLASTAVIRTRRKTIAARSPTQVRYIEALARDQIIFALGPAGTGKTYLAVAQAVSQLIAGSVDRLILSRPAVEAGERLGFLPGDMKDKVDPYLRPLYDALYDMLPAEQVERRLASGEIEIAPLAFMRGRTLASAFIILDEAQNTTPLQMKMFLTRFGEKSRMVICGDPNQVDLPNPGASGLADAVRRLDGIEGISCLRFSSREVVRHPIVGRIVDAYEGPPQDG
ncbi:phosphate starvation-inducible protein PhoH [alpha proteobacterium AAP81b]|nr:phosphate starvation-inducible protein PhoH [alpha proteobacterium AAP81b]